MVGTFALVAATVVTSLASPGVKDLRASWAPTVTGIAWHFTVPAFNDSSQCSGWIPRLVPASDSVTYHWQVYGLPIPYVWHLEDSMRVARRDSVRKFYAAWIDKNYITKHWLSRTSGDPPEYVPVCDKRARRMLMRIASYP